MDFQEKLNKEMVIAQKAQDKARLSTLRMIKTAVHNREIDLKRKMNESEFLQVLSSLMKQRKDAIEQFRKGGRDDLVAKEEAELKVIMEFMPSQMSQEEIANEIEKVIQQLGASGIRDMGKVMKEIMPRLTGKADGKLVGEMVKVRLSG